MTYNKLLFSLNIITKTKSCHLDNGYQIMCRLLLSEVWTLSRLQIVLTTEYGVFVLFTYLFSEFDIFSLK